MRKMSVFAQRPARESNRASRSVRRALVALLIGALAVLTAPAAAPASPGVGKPAAYPAGAETTVTLITGDQVRLIKQAKGYRAVASAGRGRTGVVFGTQQLGDSVWVFPSDTVALVASGRLDRRLFEVSALTEYGYGDDRQATIPLIVEHSKGELVPALPRGAARTRELDSISSSLVRQDKRTATGFWTWLTGSTATIPGRRLVLDGAYTNGVRRVWLDAPTDAALGGSVPRTDVPPVGVRTPVSTALEPELYDVSVDITDRNGAKVTSYEQGQLVGTPFLIDLTNDGNLFPLLPEAGKWIARVPRGTYTIGLHVLTPTGNGPPSSTLMSEPRLVVTGPVTVSFDARGGKRATATGDVTAARTETIGTALYQRAGTQVHGISVTVSHSTIEPEAYVVGTRTTKRDYMFGLYQQLSASDRTYELVFDEFGSLPADPVYPVYDEDLADLSIVFATPGPRSRATYSRGVGVSGADMAFGFGRSYDMMLPATRRHLVTPKYPGGPGIDWNSGLDAYTSTDAVAYREQLLEEGAYQPGSRVRLKLGTAAFTPHAQGYHHTSGWLYVDVGPFNSSGGGWTYISTGTVTGDVVLKRNGVRIAASQDPYLVESFEELGAATYTVIMHAGRQVPWSDYAPTVSGTWTFKSSRPSSGETRLPIISTRVSGDFDSWGQAPAGQVFPLALDITGTAGEVRTVTVRVSYDDGNSWLTVPVSDASGQWVARVRHPRATGSPFVSLRVIVTDSRGNSAGWTAYRSYRIAGSD
ncbi:hypothetical protein [Flindersiella endophytica]